MKKSFSGCFPALVTPMREDGNRLNHAINFETIKKLISYVLKAGVTGLVPSGCTGHAASLTAEEQVGLIRFVRENAPEKIPVFAGDGSNCTREAIDLAKRIEDIGVKTHLQISPYQNKPTQQGLFEHYAAIAKAIDGEIIIYNVPSRTGKNVEAETTIRLAREFSNIVGIKEASGNLEQIKKIIAGTADLPFSVLSGDDAMTLELMKAGGTGCVSVAANIAPKQTSQYIKLALEGEMQEAAKIEAMLRELFRVLFIETNPSPAHFALRKMGFAVGIPRLPLVDVMPESARQIETVLKQMELI